MNWQSPTFRSIGYRDGVPVHYYNRMTLHVPYLSAAGMSLLLQAGNKNIVIDLGTSTGTSDMIAYLQSMGITKVDLLIITHPHVDHVGQLGIASFLSNFTVNEIWNSGHPTPYWFDGETLCPDDEGSRTAYDSVLDSIFPAGWMAGVETDKPIIQGTSIVPYREPRLGDELTYGDLSISVFHPETLSTDLNASSFCARFDWGGSRFLITSDNITAMTAELLANVSALDLVCDVLQVGHHGNNNSNVLDNNFLTAANPTYAFLQHGTPAEPDSAVVAALSAAEIPLYNPADFGKEVVFYTDGTTTVILPNTSMDYAWESPIFS